MLVACPSVDPGLVVYGCGNERFGGNGSTLSLHECPALPGSEAYDPTTAFAATTSIASASACATTPPMPLLQGSPYPSISGVMKEEAIDILKRFYARGNQNIPLEKRHRKGVVTAGALAAEQSASIALPTRGADSPSSPTEPEAKRIKL